MQSGEGGGGEEKKEKEEEKTRRRGEEEKGRRGEEERGREKERARYGDDGDDGRAEVLIVAGYFKRGFLCRSSESIVYGF